MDGVCINDNYVHYSEQRYWMHVVVYRRTGFKCEHVIIANCDFSPSTQLLERNVYITHSVNQYVARA